MGNLGHPVEFTVHEFCSLDNKATFQQWMEDEGIDCLEIKKFMFHTESLNVVIVHVVDGEDVFEDHIFDVFPPIKFVKGYTPLTREALP